MGGELGPKQKIPRGYHRYYDFSCLSTDKAVLPPPRPTRPMRLPGGLGGLKSKSIKWVGLMKFQLLIEQWYNNIAPWFQCIFSMALTLLLGLIDNLMFGTLHSYSYRAKIDVRTISYSSREGRWCNVYKNPRACWYGIHAPHHIIILDNILTENIVWKLYIHLQKHEKRWDKISLNVIRWQSIQKHINKVLRHKYTLTKVRWNSWFPTTYLG